MYELAKEVMRISRTGIWVNPDMAVDEAAKAVLEALDKNIKILVQRAVEDEREACAKVCDEMWHEWLDSPIENEPNKPDAEDCAKAIRARSKK